MGGRDMYANSDAPVEFENEFFKGRMLFLLQTNPPDPKVIALSAFSFFAARMRWNRCCRHLGFLFVLEFERDTSCSVHFIS